MIHFIVLAGSSGEKLWPLSRQKMPKQFLKLIDDDKSLFQITINRFIELKKNLSNYEFNLIIVCNEFNKYLVKEQTEEVIIKTYPDCFNFKIIAEPKNMKTTTAIATSLEFTDNQDKIIIIPSDQIWDDYEFISCIQNMINFNYDGISLIGVKPYYPATRFGYINCKNNILVNFVEKPSLEAAHNFMDSEESNYLWNTGVLFFEKKVMINELNKNFNGMLVSIKNAVNTSQNVDNIITLDEDYFDSFEGISIEHSILENYKNGYVFEYKNYWNDIDNFKSLFDFLPKDKDFNIFQSKDDNILSIDTSNSFIYSDHKLVTTIGIDNMIIVDTRDSLLIADKNASLKVNEIVKLLKSRSRSEYVVNPICYKPWGWYINLDGSDFSGHKVKKICIYQNQRLSLQSHKDRSEHWIIIKGTAKVQIGDDHHILNVNQSLYIPKGVLHRIENVTDSNIELIETQVGSYLGEDDIVRYQDDFGRKISKNNLSDLLKEDF